MASNEHISYRVRPDATPEHERSALATAFRVLFEEDQEQAAARPGDGEDDGNNDPEVPANASIRQS